MNALASLQQDFQRAVIGDGRQAAVAHRGAITGRLEIYVNAYRGRLTEVLADNYPILYRAMGDEGFRALADAYISAHPSGFRSVRWYGDRLTDFIARNADSVPHPALADIARMDWAMSEAFDAADATPLTHADVADIAPERWPAMRFEMIPSFRLIQVDWAVEALWHALNQDENAETDAPEACRHRLIIWRRGLDTHWRAPDSTEALGLAVILNKGSFADCCAALAENHVTDPASSASLLLRWIADGLIAGAAFEEAGSERIDARREDMAGQSTDGN